MRLCERVITVPGAMRCEQFCTASLDRILDTYAFHFTARFAPPRAPLRSRTAPATGSRSVYDRERRFTNLWATAKAPSPQARKIVVDGSGVGLVITPKSPVTLKIGVSLLLPNVLDGGKAALVVVAVKAKTSEAPVPNVCVGVPAESQSSELTRLTLVGSITR